MDLSLETGIRLFAQLRIEERKKLFSHIIEDIQSGYTKWIDDNCTNVKREVPTKISESSEEARVVIFRDFRRREGCEEDDNKLGCKRNTQWNL